MVQQIESSIKIRCLLCERANKNRGGQTECPRKKRRADLKGEQLLRYLVRLGCGLRVGLESWFYATRAWLLVLRYLVRLSCGLRVGLGYGFYPTWAWLLVFCYLPYRPGFKHQLMFYDVTAKSIAFCFPRMVLFLGGGVY